MMFETDKTQYHGVCAQDEPSPFQPVPVLSHDFSSATSLLCRHSTSFNRVAPVPMLWYLVSTAFLAFLGVGFDRFWTACFLKCVFPTFSRWLSGIESETVCWSPRSIAMGLLQFFDAIYNSGVSHGPRTYHSFDGTFACLSTRREEPIPVSMGTGKSSLGRCGNRSAYVLERD